MSQGRVYEWMPGPDHPLGGRVRLVTRPLPRLDAGGEGSLQLSGRYVHVRNGGMVPEPDPASGPIRAVSIGDAQPDAKGDFVFEPGRGGGRLDKVERPDPAFRERYIQAAHFGEVNTYFHLDRIAAYLDLLLRGLGAPSLPRVTAVVNAHHAAVEVAGLRDAVRRGDRLVVFQGGHYRLPARRYDVPEWEPIAPEGEIHLGPGRELLLHGALVEAAGGSYRANASHNAGILYHEYGHHLTRHTADFRANALRPPDRQNNRKTALDEGTCDYWVAAMLDTPHIWAWHRRHDEEEIHPRSLMSRKTMREFDASPNADPHANGTIWAAALWELRCRLAALETDGAHAADRLVVQALLLIGREFGPAEGQTVRTVRQARESFATGLRALLQADGMLYDDQHAGTIREVFGERGIVPAEEGPTGGAWGAFACPSHPSVASGSRPEACQKRTALRGVRPEEIPHDEELLSSEALSLRLAREESPRASLVAVGDVMLGDRAARAIATYGPDYPFRSVLPLLRSGEIVLGNLEGPFAHHAERQPRQYAYRVAPAMAHALTEAGFTVLTLANNHLLDCGRDGVLETLAAVNAAGMAAIGAGCDEAEAHRAVIQHTNWGRVGLLGYYWNRRCAATPTLPGSAMDTREALQADIGRVRPLVEWLVVTFHWGIPYEREPLPEDREKARWAIDCGADLVIGHHPHVVQPFEVYRDRPIFYSLGNFAFGSGNSRAEGLLLRVRFGPAGVESQLFPVYVKNRDPRVNYQPRILTGRAAMRVLDELRGLCGEGGEQLRIRAGVGTLRSRGREPGACRVYAGGLHGRLD